MCYCAKKSRKILRRWYGHSQRWRSQQKSPKTSVNLFLLFQRNRPSYFQIDLITWIAILINQLALLGLFYVPLVRWRRPRSTIRSSKLNILTCGLCLGPWELLQVADTVLKFDEMIGWPYRPSPRIPFVPRAKHFIRRASLGSWIFDTVCFAALRFSSWFPLSVIIIEDFENYRRWQWICKLSGY